MKIIQLILAAIGAVCVFGFLCFAIGAIWLAWEGWKTERNEVRLWQQEQKLRERDEDTKPYPGGMA